MDVVVVDSTHTDTWCTQTVWVWSTTISWERLQCAPLEARFGRIVVELHPT